MANRPRAFLREVLSLAAMALVVATARSSFADHYVVPSGSMLPTVHVGDRILVAKAAYGVRVPFTHVALSPQKDPARGDVIVLTSPESGDVLLKRVVALAGDTVEVRGGHVWLNGRPARDAAARSSASETLSGRRFALDLDDGGGPDFGPARVPAGHLLVLGDNRGNSHDSRGFGYVARDAVLGRAVAVAWRDGSPTYLPL